MGERPNCEFSGLKRSAPQHGGVVDGNATSQWWHYALATKATCHWNTATTGRTTAGIPGPTVYGKCYMVKCVELWIKHQPVVALMLTVSTSETAARVELSFTSLGGTEVACIQAAPEEDYLSALWTQLSSKVGVPCARVTVMTPQGISARLS